MYWYAASYRLPLAQLTAALTVVIQSRNPTTKRIQHLAVNACLAPLISVDGKHIITVEGVFDFITLQDQANYHSQLSAIRRTLTLSRSACGSLAALSAVSAHPVSS